MCDYNCSYVIQIKTTTPIPVPSLNSKGLKNFVKLEKNLLGISNNNNKTEDNKKDEIGKGLIHQIIPESFGKNTIASNYPFRRICVGYVILDDGWQRVNQSHKSLQSFEANEKFPNGLKSLIQNIKERYFYLKQFGVWHPICQDYNNHNLIIRNGDDKSIHIITSKFIKSFYDDFYKYLSSQGINLIKADHLASFDSIKSNEIEHIQWWKDYLEALRKGSRKYFKNRIIYCMSHSPQIMQEILMKDNDYEEDEKEENKDGEEKNKGEEVAEEEDIDKYKPILRNNYNNHNLIIRNGDDKSIHIITSKFIKSFYDDFYKYLSSQGINLIKADHLASFDSIKSNEIEHIQWWKDYLEALRKGSRKYFKNRIIYCMSHSPQIMQEILMKDNDYEEDEKEENKDGEEKNKGEEVAEEEDIDKYKPILRNSDDFFPHVYDSHPDMFQSHAAARAISGGPIYISDPPNQHNVEIFKRCVVKSVLFEIINSPINNNNCNNDNNSSINSQGFIDRKFTKAYSQRILRCDYPELPSLSILFDDVTKVNKLLKISNINNQRIGELGLWNCRNNEIVDKFGIDDFYRIKINDDDDGINNINGVNNINGINHINGINKINVINNINNVVNNIKNGNDNNIVTISPMDILLINEAGGSETTTIAKVEIACFGLIDKYNGSKAIGDDNLPKFVNEGFEDYFNNFPECNVGLYDNKNDSKKKNISSIKIKENYKKGIVFYKVDLIGYGECGFYLNVINGTGRRNEIYEIKENQSEVINYDKENKLLIVSLCENENVIEDELLEYKRRKSEFWEGKDDKMLKLFLEIKIEIQFLFV
ncbi:hypothetical protein Glove_421g81 [Diversispora epigaea]|uniref:Uncharacterized protein n=1 Tax=Diversispora epigaea TaxID=1348612 RepID=A0A397H0W1_9GLOM|nr:hypothetical protein Glove_421g81 [Diversispora epigaea]